MTDVFISYSRKDTEFVRVLYDAFEASQQKTWVDWKNIPLTADWWAEIERGIEAADTFVFVISPDSIASKVCADEINHAVRNNKRLFPIVRRDATNFEEGNHAHDAIKQHNWLMFREQDDFESAFKTLTETISLDLEHLHSHTRLLVRAIEWGKGRSDSLLLRGDDLANAEQWLGVSEGKDPQPTELQRNYIRSSREVEDASHRAAAILQEAVQKAAARTKIGVAILVGTLLLAGVTGVGAWVTVGESQKQAKQAQADTESAKREKADAEGKALSADQKAKLADQKTQQAARDLKATKVEADKAVDQAKVAKEQADAEVTKAKDELGKLQQEAEMQLASAKAELAQAEASTQQSEAARQIALNKIALADVKLKTVNVKVALLDNDGINFMLQAVAVADQLKKIPNQGKEWQDLKQSVVSLLQQATYLVPKQNRLEGHTGRVISANFSADGSKIVTASWDGTARVWDVKGNLIAELKGHTGRVYSANFSADGSKIVTASWDGTARVWDVKGNLIAELKGHTGYVDSANFSADGSKIVTASLDNTARVWDVKGTLIAELKGHTGGVNSA
ncbi:MAG: TIR domain-containing protein, partial [Pseudanabaena sp. ELA607]